MWVFLVLLAFLRYFPTDEGLISLLIRDIHEIYFSNTKGAREIHHFPPIGFIVKESEAMISFLKTEDLPEIIYQNFSAS